MVFDIERHQENRNKFLAALYEIATEESSKQNEIRPLTGFYERLFSQLSGWRIACDSLETP
jgi:hypothetical protein